MLLALPAAAQNCDSMTASISGGWQPISTAPRDGRTVEILNTYGVAPWYGLFKWTKSYDAEVTTFDGNMRSEKSVTRIEHLTDSKPSWHSVTQLNTGLAEGFDSCLFWRPYKGTGKYVDPTGGAQNTIAYWCAHVGLAYDKKKDACKEKP